MHKCPFCLSNLLSLTNMSGSAIGAPISFVTCMDCNAIGPTAKTPREAWDKWDIRYLLTNLSSSFFTGVLRNCVFCNGKKSKVRICRSGFYVECQKCKSSGSVAETPKIACEKWNDIK